MAYTPYREEQPYPPAAEPVLPTHVPIPTHPALWTYVFLALNALVWLAMTLAGGSENALVLLRFGAKFHPFIVAGEYWRLVTANFLHIGIIHLAFNSYALYLFGLQVERRFGRIRFVVLYLLAGVGGTVLSYVGSESLSAGASGAIFGLVGAITVYFATYRDAFGSQGRRQLSSLLLITAYNLVWGFMSTSIDNLGHIGGLVVGLALGWAFCPRYKLAPDSETGLALVDRYSVRRALIVTLATGGLLGALTYLGTLIHTLRLVLRS